MARAACDSYVADPNCKGDTSCDECGRPRTEHRMFARFTITTPSSDRITGAVQGAGGLVAGPRALERLRTDAVRAAAGKRLSCYEPAPGHVLVYPQCTNLDAGPSVSVPLAGVSVEVAK